MDRNVPPTTGVDPRTAITPAEGWNRPVALDARKTRTLQEVEAESGSDADTNRQRNLRDFSIAGAGAEGPIESGRFRRSGQAADPETGGFHGPRTRPRAGGRGAARRLASGPRWRRFTRRSTPRRSTPGAVDGCTLDSPSRHLPASRVVERLQVLLVRTPPKASRLERCEGIDVLAPSNASAGSTRTSRLATLPKSKPTTRSELEDRPSRSAACLCDYALRSP